MKEVKLKCPVEKSIVNGIILTKQKRRKKDKEQLMHHTSKRIRALLILFLFFFSLIPMLSPSVSATVEDFTAFTEVDTDNIWTNTSTRVTVTNADRNQEDYVYKDYGTDYFGSSWEHKFTIKINSISSEGLVILYAQANVLDAYSDMTNSIGLLFQTPGDGSDLTINLVDKTGVTDTYTNTNHDGNKIYYMTLIRSGTTLTLYIYNDTGRTDLADTLSITMVDLDYRYLYAGTTDRAGGGGYTMTGYIENLELITLNVITNETTGIELTNATARGFINSSLGFSGNYDYGFYVGRTSLVNESNADQNVTGAGTVATGDNFSYNILSLNKGTHYYDRAWISNATFFGVGNEIDFYTKCDAPTGFTAVSTDCSVTLAWTKGTGADKTTIRRKSSSYPTSPTDGIAVYNGTSSSYSDANGGHQYYRAWSWAGDKHSDGNASVNITVPICPPTGVTGEILINNTLNISWTKGAGANTTVVIRKSDSSPTSRTDGTVIYNSTGTHTIETDLASNYYFRLWSYANGTYSTSVPLDFGALVVNCYSEETNASLYFDIIVRNESGTQSYESKNNTNPLVINIADDLPLGNNIRIIVSPASNYSAKTETFAYPITKNSTITYVILKAVPENKDLTNVTCRNTTASTNSYPAFTLADDVITILADAADEFNQITVNYTHYEYDSRTYYRNLIGNHVYTLDAFLPDADKTELYVLQVVNDFDIPVESADLEIKVSINGTYEIVSLPKTDANGKVSVYLTPGKDHLIRISKTGYESKNISFIPDPDYYGSYYPIIFRITAEEIEIITVTFGDLITFTGEWVTTNNTLKVYFNDKDSNTTDVTFSVYESYGTYLNLTNRIAFGSITTTTLYFSGLNTSRMHQVRLEMNHTKLGHILNQTIYVAPFRNDSRAKGSWIDSIIGFVMGDFDYGYALFALAYFPCVIFIILFGAISQAGFGVFCAGLYIILLTWRIDLSNTFLYSLASLFILFGIIMIIVQHGKKLTGRDST